MDPMEFFQELSQIQANQWVEIALATHALASTIVAATPTPADDAVLAPFYKLLEVASLTVGRAKESGKRSRL